MTGVLTLPGAKTSTLSDATFACPDLTTFCRPDELGLDVGQRLEPDRAVLACRVVGRTGVCWDWEDSGVAAAGGLTLVMTGNAAAESFGAP